MELYGGEQKYQRMPSSKWRGREHWEDGSCKNDSEKGKAPGSMLSKVRNTISVKNNLASVYGGNTEGLKKGIDVNTWMLGIVYNNNISGLPLLWIRRKVYERATDLRPRRKSEYEYDLELGNQLRTEALSCAR